MWILFFYFWSPLRCVCEDMEERLYNLASPKKSWKRVGEIWSKPVLFLKLTNHRAGFNRGEWCQLMSSRMNFRWRRLWRSRSEKLNFDLGNNDAFTLGLRISGSDLEKKIQIPRSKTLESRTKNVFRTNPLPLYFWNYAKRWPWNTGNGILPTGSVL